MITISIYGLGVSLALMTGLWFVSLLIKNVSVIDVFWSLTILSIGWVYFLESELIATRHLILSILNKSVHLNAGIIFTNLNQLNMALK